MKKNKFEHTGILVLHILLLAVALAVSYWGWVNIPDAQQIPTHWNIHGEIDGYSSKNFGLLLLPGAMLFSLLFMTIGPLVEPRKKNLSKSNKAYKLIWATQIGLLLVLHIALVASGAGYIVNMITITSLTMGVLFIVMGNYLGKISSNFLFGIRNRWTLSGDGIWDKTHRFAGRIYVVLGVLTLASVFVQSSVITMGLILLLVLSSLLVFVYSFLLWRKEKIVG